MRISGWASCVAASLPSATPKAYAVNGSSGYSPATPRIPSVPNSCLLKPSPCLARVRCAPHARRVHILTERGVDLLQGERLDPGFQSLVIEQGAAQLFVRSDEADQRRLLGTAHFAGVGIGALGLGDFGLGEAFLQRLLQLIAPSARAPSA